MLNYIIQSFPVYFTILSVSVSFYDDNTEVHNYFATQRHSLTLWFPHTTLVIMDNNFLVENPIDLKFSGSNVMLLKYYRTIPCFSDYKQAVINHIYFLKTSF